MCLTSLSNFFWIFIYIRDLFGAQKTSEMLSSPSIRFSACQSEIYDRATPLSHCLNSRAGKNVCSAYRTHTLTRIQLVKLPTHIDPSSTSTHTWLGECSIPMLVIQRSLCLKTRTDVDGTK